MKSLTLDTWLTVQFCPSGEVERRSVRWILQHQGRRALEKIKRGLKLDAPIFHDSMWEDSVIQRRPLP
jgi:hypothetical protein